MRRRGRALPSLLIDQPPDARLTSRDSPAAVMRSEWRDPADTSPNACQDRVHDHRLSRVRCGAH
jgi:hypothetical protein